MPTNCWSFPQLSVIPTQKPQKPLTWSPLSRSQSWSTNLFRIIRYEIVRFRHSFNFYGSPKFPKLLVISFNPNVICVSISATHCSGFVPMNPERKVLQLRTRISQKIFSFYPCLDIRRVRFSQGAFITESTRDWNNTSPWLDLVYIMPMVTRKHTLMKECWRKKTSLSVVCLFALDLY